MIYTEKFFRWDTQDVGNDNEQGGEHPYPGRHDKNIKIEYCYYQPKY